MALPFSCHFEMFVDFGHGIQARDFCMKLFDAITVYEKMSRVGISGTAVCTWRVYLQIPGRPQIIEIQECLPDETRQIIETPEAILE